MTVQNPPVFIQSESHPAEDVRRLFHAQMAGRAGIVGATDFLVTQNGTPNMGVSVAGGQVFISGSEATYQGLYFVENRGPTSLTIDAADATNPRIDLVVVKVQDSQYSGSTRAASLAVVKGTPSATPTPPTVPANCLVLAEVYVENGVSSIINADITDKRRSQTYSGSSGVLASALGGFVVCTSTVRPSSPRVGTPIFDEDTGYSSIWNGTTYRRFAYDDVVTQRVPAGMIAMWAFSSPPSGWLKLEGQTVTNAQSLYPDLWAIAPTGWKSGSSLILPDTRNRFPVGLGTDTEFNTLLLTGGAKTKSLSVSEMPSHTHSTPNHQHTGTTSSNGFHTHTVGRRDGGNTTPSGTLSGNAFSSDANSFTSGDGAHTHTFTTDSGGGGTTGSAGTGAAFQMLPPYIVVTFIIKT